MNVLFIRHIDLEGPGLLEPLVREAGLTPKVIALDEGDSLPENFDDIATVVVLGGPMNVHEEEKYPFLKKENEFLKETLRRGIPLLGICLGSQLIAKACGAKVGDSPVKEIGWHPAALTSAGQKDPVFRGIGGELTVFHWHEDMFGVPNGAELVVTAPKGCANQGFRLGSGIYAFQFHIEVTFDMIREWGEAYLTGPAADKERQIREMLGRHAEVKRSFEQQARVIGNNFMAMAAERAVLKQEGT